MGGETVVGNAGIVAKHAKLHRTIAWEDGYFGEFSSLTECTLADRNIVKDHVSVGEGSVVIAKVWEFVNG